jgi:hypothetical protein
MENCLDRDAGALTAGLGTQPSSDHGRETMWGRLPANPVAPLL